ncbi:MAG TPA: hydrogenase nickel incorporation protein HypA [Treponema sp.]|nr:hydrogenase nickel incorporation protein HypA [Treponema sp.]
MHELGIVFHIISEVEDICKENNLTKVAAVTIQFGEVSMIIPDYLGDCWKWAAEKSGVLKGAELKTESLPAVTMCDDCGKTYSTVQYGRICPYCASGSTHLVSGQEIMIKEIEAC